MGRVVKRVVACVVVGVVVNVLVAWGLALWTPVRMGSPLDLAISSWPAPAPSGWPSPVTQQRYGGIGWTWRMAIVDAEGTTYGMSRVDFGLPCRTLSYAQAGTIYSGRAGAMSKIRLAGLWAAWELLDVSWQRGLSTRERVVPLRPIWVGSVANIGLYGTAAWLVLFVPSLIRTHRRARRGRCLACGYELAGLASDRVCPECGSEVAAARWRFPRAMPPAMRLGAKGVRSGESEVEKSGARPPSWPWHTNEEP